MTRTLDKTKIRDAATEIEILSRIILECEERLQQLFDELLSEWQYADPQSDRLFYDLLLELAQTCPKLCAIRNLMTTSATWRARHAELRSARGCDVVYPQKHETLITA